MGFLRVPWLPYAVIAVIAVSGGLYGVGFIQGSRHAEADHLEAMTKALDEQRERMLSQADREKTLALTQLRAKYEIQQQVNSVPTPSVSCDLPLECLQWGDSVAGTPAYSERAD